MVRKIISVLIISSILVSAVIVSAASESYDINNVVVLSKLNIIERFDKGAYNPETPISNSEFVSMLANFLDMTYIENDELLRRLGAIGEGEEFNDRKQCTAGFAVKADICALGYKDYVDYKYANENGYMTVAVQLGLIPKMLDKDALLTRGEAVALIYNSLDAEPYAFYSATKKDDGSYDINYSLKKKSTALYYYKKIYKEEGVVTDNSFISLYGSSLMADNEVVIGGETYYCEDDTDEFVGKYVCAYIKEDDVRDRVVSLSEASGKNRIIKINAEDYRSFSMANRVFNYVDENGKKKSVKTEPGIAVIYNNGGLKKFDDTVFDDVSGYITFIDNDNNGDFDVAIIEDFETVFVSGVYSYDKTVYNMFSCVGISDKIDFEEDEEVKCKYIKNGSKAGFEDIYTGSILRVLQNKSNDKRLITVYISDNAFEGMVTKIDSKSEKLCIDKKEYELSDSYKKMIGLDEKYAPSLKAGDRYIFYIDSEGMVAAADSDLRSINKIGYLSGVSSNGVFDKVCKVKIFESSGRWVIYTLADKVDYNSVDKMSAENVIDAVGTTPQMVSYRLNDDKKITALYTKDAPSEKFTMQNLGSLRYSNGTYLTFGGTYFINKGSTIFYIPEDGDTEKFSVSDISLLPTATVYNNVTGYNIDEYNASSCFSIRMDSNFKRARYTASNIFVINEVSEALGSDGAVIKQISGITGDFTYFSMDMSDDADGVDEIAGEALSYKHLKSGDVITFMTNTDGMIGEFKRFFSIGKEGGMPAPNPNTIMSSYGGKVKSIDRKAKRVMLDNNGSTLIVGMRDATKYYVYNNDLTGKSRILFGKFDEIQVGDYIYSRVDYGSANDVVIYKGLK